MATIDSDYVQQMATQLANYEVQRALAKNERMKTGYQSKLDAVNKLDSALKSFRTAVKSLNGVGSSMLVNSAKFSQEGYASASVGSAAQPGTYQFFVEKLASTHQIGLNNLTDADVQGASGVLQFKDASGVNSFAVDLSTIDADGNGNRTLDELAKAINGAAGNSGVKAALVRSNGQVSLVLSAEQSGAASAFSLASPFGAGQLLSQGRDAEVRLGGEAGMLLTSASNTFDNLIDGVSLTFSKTHVSGETPLSLTIGQDPSATKAQVQKFIDAFNSLMTSLDGLTASGGESGQRGPLAGDASIRSIENMLNQVVRGQFGGVSLIDFGIAADRNGKLSIDAARFDKAVAAKPEAFEKLFGEKDALLDSVDKNLGLYVASAGGVLSNRKDSLNLGLKRVSEDYEAIQQQYDNYYNRYLQQYTSMMQTMAAMQQTSGLFV
jgi:flagellar hook-associated protein 2